MKLFKMLKNNVVTFKKKFVILILLMLALITIIAISIYKGDNTIIKYSIFDILAHVTGKMGIVGYLSLSGIVLPIFSLILTTIIDNEKNVYFIIRNKSRVSTWNKISIYTIYLSAFFTFILVIGGYFISGVVVSNFNNCWASSNSIIYTMIENNVLWENVAQIFTTPRMLSIISMSIFLGLCTCGFLINLMKMLFNKNIYIFLILIIIFFVDASMDSFSFFLKQMTINAFGWIKPVNIFINDLYLLCLTILFYILGKIIIVKKDFITSK